MSEIGGDPSEKKLQIYFAGAISAGRDYAPIYSQIISYLSEHGQVMTPELGDPSMGLKGEALTAEMIHDRDLEWIQNSDVLVAEASTPSLGVGYQIAVAAGWKKPILILHRPGERPLSSMILGSRSVVYRPYKITMDIPQILDEFFAQLSEMRAEAKQ